MIARGQRPLFRLRAQDGGWTVDAMSWLTIDASGRREALEAARSAIAEWLEVEPLAFELE